MNCKYSRYDNHYSKSLDCREKMKLWANVKTVYSDCVKAISILLEKEGYRILKAYDGMQALELLSQNKVHLVLMDVMMPRLDGLSAVMRIREKQNIPIIVLSAKSEETDKVLGLSIPEFNRKCHQIFAGGFKSLCDIKRRRRTCSGKCKKYFKSGIRFQYRFCGTFYQRG